MEYDKLMMIGYFYYLLCNNVYYFSHNIEICSRVYSTIHASLAIIGSWVYLYTGSYWVYSITVHNSIAYCLFDFPIILLVERLRDPLMIFHHAAFLFGLWYFYQQHPSSVSRALLMETSTIPLNISWYMYKFNKTGSIFFTTTLICLLVSFFMFRIVGLTLSVIYAPSSFAMYFLGTLLALNTFWFTKLSRLCYQKVWRR